MDCGFDVGPRSPSHLAKLPALADPLRDLINICRLARTHFEGVGAPEVEAGGVAGDEGW